MRRPAQGRTTKGYIRGDRVEGCINRIETHSVSQVIIANTTPQHVPFRTAVP